MSNAANNIIFIGLAVSIAFLPAFSDFSASLLHMPKRKHSASEDKKAMGRKPSIGLLESLVQKLERSTEKYENKKKKSKQRSDSFLAKVLEYLAPSDEGQQEILQRYITGLGLQLENKGGNCENMTIKKLCTSFENARCPRERNYLLQFVRHLSLETLRSLGFNSLARGTLQRSRINGMIPFQKRQREMHNKNVSPKQQKRNKQIAAMCKAHSVPSWTSGAARHCAPEDVRRTLTLPVWNLAKEAHALGICAASTFVANIPEQFVKPAALKELGYHRDCAARQENAFRACIKRACAEGSRLLVIRLDYKGGTVIGHSAVERDDAVYGFGIVRICGFVAWFHCSSLPMPVYVDAVSGVLDSDSSVSCVTLKLAIEKLLHNQETSAAIQKVDTLMPWCDCGQHFRSQVFVYSALWETFGWLKSLERASANFFVEKHGKGECDQHFSVVERYKSHYEQHMKRIENVADFIVAQEAIMGAKNMLRRLAHEPQIRWLFAQYCASDIPKVPRKACVIPRIQSTYCLLRERRQPSNEIWNLIFSGTWNAQMKHQCLTIAITQKGERKQVREASGVKSTQGSNISKLRRKREFQQCMLAGSRGPMQVASLDSSDDEPDESD